MKTISNDADFRLLVAVNGSGALSPHYKSYCCLQEEALAGIPIINSYYSTQDVFSVDLRKDLPSGSLWLGQQYR